MNAPQPTARDKDWRQSIKEARRVTDKLGLPIDKDILETVVALRLLGFNTTASCAGHLRRNTSGPYVIIQSLKGQQFAQQARDIGSTKTDAYRKLRKKAEYERARELGTLTELLADFYAHHPLDYRHHLIVQSMSMTMNILKCHNADQSFALNATQKKELLLRNQAEMHAFMNYLKEKFYQN